ncbi:NAD-dependent epimerase/dehydratase [Calothrix sp. NIES-4071]|nr:NAD-dependent epimerase/dehydratase [Calothrix sp. NIES-4071]BAZ63509.1 NAD-dependent epimerase/dehydratase [Calothrix sp. NIES-4105]
MTTSIFLAGASRGVGREIALSLTKQGHHVIALLRSEASRAELEAIGASVVIGDAMVPDDLKRGLGQSEKPIDVVISTIGGLPQDGIKPDYPGNKNLIDAAVAKDVKKFILVTSIGTGNSVSALSPQTLAVLQPVLIEKDKAEQHLINSGLTYTIVRPGGLKSEPATGNGVLTEDIRIIGTIHRADVADLVCRTLDTRADNKILSAVDKNMLFGQFEFGIFDLS